MRKLKLFSLALMALFATSVWATEVTVGFTTGLGDKNATTSTRSIEDADHITITHLINSGTTDALSLYNKSDKDLYYGSSTATYCYNGYKWNKSTSGFNDNYVGFQVDVEDGYTLSLSELEVTLAVSANFVCKVEIVDDADNVLYESNSWTIANNGKNNTNGINPTFTAQANPALQDLTGTFYVRTQLQFSSTGKYLCFPIFTITGDLLSDACTLSNPSVSGGGIYRVGQDVTLTASVTGTPTSYTWKNAAGTTVGTTNPLVINDCNYSNADTYTCYMSDGDCEKSASATVVVKKVCPVNGTVFSMTITDADGTVYTDASADNWLLIGATYDGGKAYAGSQSSTGRSPKITGTEFDFSVSSGGSVVVMLVLECELEEGDVISLTSSADKEFKIQKTPTDGLVTTTSKKYTIPENSTLIGLDTIYILRNNSACKFSKIDITRPIYRTITFDSDGGSDVDDIVLVDGEVASKPTDPTKANYRFNGWYNGEVAYDWTANVTGDLNLTAHWTRVYTVTYKAGDGTGDDVVAESKAEGETFTVAANTFTAPTGKAFQKWNDGTNDYAPGVTYTVGTANVVLTAQWTKLYTVTYKAGDGTGDDVIAESKIEGATFEVAANTFTAPEGKSFQKWNDGANDYAPGDTYTVGTANVVFTAQWNTSYAITKAAVTNGSIAVSETAAAEGVKVTLTATPNTNYLLDAWDVYKTGEESTKVTVTDNQFTMPAYAVTVSATFVDDTRTKILYITATDEAGTKANDKLYAALKNDYNIHIVGYASSEALTNYSLAILHESIGGGNYNATAVAAAKTATIPVLNTKSYFYNDGRWAWGTPNAGKSVKGCNLNSTTYQYVSYHPIFADVVDKDGFVEIIDEEEAKAMQPVESFTSGLEGYTLATTPNADSGNGCAIHEIPAGNSTRGANTGKYLMISVSNSALGKLNANGQKLFQNAVAYLLSDNAWTPEFVPTALDNTVDEVKAVKVLRDGQVLIFKDGKYFNVLGQPVK